MKSVQSVAQAARPGSLLWDQTSEGGGGNAAHPDIASGVPLLHHVRDVINAVDRCAWADVCFSSDSEHLVTAAASKLSHHIYIWDRMHGKLARILEGVRVISLCGWLDGWLLP